MELHITLKEAGDLFNFPVATIDQREEFTENPLLVIIDLGWRDYLTTNQEQYLNAHDNVESYKLV